MCQGGESTSAVNRRESIPSGGRRRLPDSKGSSKIKEPAERDREEAGEGHTYRLYVIEIDPDRETSYEYS